MLKARLSLHLLAAVLFCILTIGMTWPLILKLNTHVTSGQQPAMSVPYLNLWTLAWNHHWLKGETATYWDANHFFPHQKTLAYSEPQLGIGLLTFPVVLLGGNTVLAYNLALLVFFAGAGMAVYALCWWILGIVPEISDTDKGLASITSGILYAFTPYMFKEIAVIQLLATLFAPLCLLGLHRFFSQKRLLDALLFAVSFLGCWYTCAYYGLFLSVFVACFMLFFWHRDLLHWRYLLYGFVSVIFLIVCLLPLAAGMLSAKVALSINFPETLVEGLSSRLMVYLTPPSSSLLYERILGIAHSDSSLFFGGMLFCLASVGTSIVFKAKNPKTDSKNDSINNQRQTFLHRCVFFYISMSLFAFILSLGMKLTPIHAEDLGIYRFIVWLSPYNLLYNFVPGFSSIRSAYRFAIFVVLFLSILAGIGTLWICFRFRSRWRWVLIVSLMSVTIFELWPTPLPLAKVSSKLDELPHIYQQVKKLPSEAVLIEFPQPISLSERHMEATSRQMYFSTFHWRRLINGYSGFVPKAYRELTELLAKSPAQMVLPALNAFDTQYVIAHWSEMTEKEKDILQKLESEGNLKPLFQKEKQHTLYHIDNNLHKQLNTEYPHVQHITIYENSHSRSVTLCFYYQIEKNQALLVTPWKNSVEYEIAWYRHLPFQNSGKPILVKKGTYSKSKLIHAESNTIAIDMPAPVSGKYYVVIKHHLTSHSTTKNGICEIYPHGFVRFSEEP